MPGRGVWSTCQPCYELVRSCQSQSPYHLVRGVRVAVAHSSSAAVASASSASCSYGASRSWPSIGLGTPDGPVFRASTDLVTIDAVVMDRDGKPVTNLTREDFEVTVAGKHQTLEQAVYIRTQEQPQALAAVRAAAIPRGAGTCRRKPGANGLTQLLLLAVSERRVSCEFGSAFSASCSCLTLRSRRSSPPPPHPRTSRSSGRPPTWSPSMRW